MKRATVILIFVLAMACLPRVIFLLPDLYSYLTWREPFKSAMLQSNVAFSDKSGVRFVLPRGTIIHPLTIDELWTASHPDDCYRVKIYLRMTPETWKNLSTNYNGAGMLQVYDQFVPDSISNLSAELSAE